MSLLNIVVFLGGLYTGMVIGAWIDMAHDWYNRCKLNRDNRMRKHIQRLQRRGPDW